MRAEVIAVGGFAGRAVPALFPKEKIEELLKKLDEQIATANTDLEKAKEEKDPHEAVMTKRLESYARLRERYKEQLKEMEAKEPKEAKPAELEELKIEIEIKGE